MVAYGSIRGDAAMLDFIKNFISKLLNGTSDEQSDRTQESEPLVRQWQFADYVPRIPEIILYIRRQREIPRRQLELNQHGGSKAS